MALESATFINDLVDTNPAAGDLVSQGDDHLRLIKAVLRGTFPGLSKAINFPLPIADGGHGAATAAQALINLGLPYEEGTFNSTFSCTTPGNLSMSYTSQSCTYTRIGRLVFVDYTVAGTPTWSTASGTVLFGGLPFAPAGGGGTIQHSAGPTLSGVTSSLTWLASRFIGGISSWRIRGSSSGTSSTDMSISAFPSGQAISVNAGLVYRL